METGSAKKLYHKNFEQWNITLNRKYLSPRELTVKKIENAVVLPAHWNGKRYEGGVCNSNLKFVAGFIRGKKTLGYGGMSTSYAVDRSKIEILDEDVIFGGVSVGHFGHFLSECMARLWYTLEHPELRQRIVIIVSLGGIKPWHHVFFELMGIPSERIIFLQTPMQFKSVLVPEQCMYSLESYTKEYLIPYRRIVSNITPGNVKKLYLTRTRHDENYKRRNVHCHNEKYFEDYFARKGYELIEPETLPLKQQIELVTGADEIACILGTLSHFSLFCKPGTKFIMLDRDDKDTSPLQSLINEATGIDYHIVDVSKNFMHVSRTMGELLLGSTKSWQEFVADYFGDIIEIDDDATYFDGALDDYIAHWLKKYSATPHLAGSLKEMCKRIMRSEANQNASRPQLYYETHLSKKGWLPKELENHISGLIDQQFGIEALRINFASQYYDVFYSVYYPKVGWTAEVSNGKVAGTTGKSRPIFGFKIRLDESGARKFDILYRVHDFDGNWSSWLSNGEEFISAKSRLNAIQIKVADKVIAPPPVCISKRVVVNFLPRCQNSRTSNGRRRVHGRIIHCGDYCARRWQYNLDGRGLRSACGRAFEGALSV